MTPGDPSGTKQEAGEQKGNKAEDGEAARLDLSIQVLRDEPAVWVPKNILGHPVTQGHPGAVGLGSTFGCQCLEAQVPWPRKRRRRQREISKARTEENTAQHQDQDLSVNREVME